MRMHLNWTKLIALSIGLFALCRQADAAYHWIQNDAWTQGTPFNQVSNFEYCKSGVGDQICAVLDITEDCTIDKIGVLFNGVTANLEFHILLYDGTGKSPNPGKQLSCPCGVNVPMVVSGPGFVVFDLLDPQINWQVKRKAGDKLAVCVLYMGDVAGSGDVNMDICSDTGKIKPQANLIKKCNPHTSPWESCEKYGLDHNLIIRAGWWVPDPTATPAPPLATK